MAYMRGDNYFWSDEASVHLWSRTGQDYWSDSGWASSNNKSQSVTSSGVGIPNPVMDEFVLMRFAEIFEAGELKEVIDRALKNHHGNGGCSDLAKHRNHLVKALGTDQ